jgi:hypothetical protein
VCKCIGAFMKWSRSHFHLNYIILKGECGSIMVEALRLATLPPSATCMPRQCVILNVSQPYRPPQPLTGIDLLYFTLHYFTLLYFTLYKFGYSFWFLHFWMQDHVLYFLLYTVCLWCVHNLYVSKYHSIVDSYMICMLY